MNKYNTQQPTIPCPACGALIKHKSTIDFDCDITTKDLNIDLPVSKLKHNPIKLEKRGESVTITYPDTGFNSEKLTFDGVVIKEGDKIDVARWRKREVIGGNLGYLAVLMNVESHNRIRGTKVYMPIVALNITAHYPSKIELEEAREELKKFEGEVYDSYWRYFENKTEISEALLSLDKYYKARKKVEELENN